MNKLPIRVQRKRSKDFKIGNLVYVGRPSQWGNPAKIGDWYLLPRYSLSLGTGSVLVKDNRIAVAAFYEYCIARAEKYPYEFASWLRPLVGRDLCCWCSPDQVCHADILLFFANSIFYRPAEPGKNNVLETFVVPIAWPTLAEIVGWKSAL